MHENIINLCVAKCLVVRTALKYSKWVKGSMYFVNYILAIDPYPI